MWFGHCIWWYYGGCLHTRINILEVKVDKESKPCESCRFKPECRYAHDFEVEECKDWGAREEDEE